VAAHGDQIRVDGKRLAIVGNSVGGKHDGSRGAPGEGQRRAIIQMSGAALAVTDANFDTESYQEYAEGYFLSRAMMKWFGTPMRPRPQRVMKSTPHRCKRRSNNSKDFPGARASGRKRCATRRGPGLCAETGRQGVDVTVVRCENLIHDYGLLNAISQVPAVRDALHQVAETLKKHLS
jgi:acetyl esterase/lipase